EGNPFYVGELLRHLVESGALVQQPDGRFRLEGRIEDLGLPQSVREVVGRRVARLSEPAQRVLGVAAVIGRDFDVDLLSRIVDAGADEPLDYAGRAGARALAELAPDDALRWFDQALELQAEQSDADTAVRCELLIGRGQAQRLTGEGDFRDTLLDASRLARDLGDPELLARACVENTRGQASQHGEVDAERVDLLETA